MQHIQAYSHHHKCLQCFFIRQCSAYATWQIVMKSILLYFYDWEPTKVPYAVCNRQSARCVGRVWPETQKFIHHLNEEVLPHRPATQSPHLPKSKSCIFGCRRFASSMIPR